MINDLTCLKCDKKTKEPKIEQKKETNEFSIRNPLEVERKVYSQKLVPDWYLAAFRLEDVYYPVKEDLNRQRNLFSGYADGKIEEMINKENKEVKEKKMKEPWPVRSVIRKTYAIKLRKSYMNNYDKEVYNKKLSDLEMLKGILCNDIDNVRPETKYLGIDQNCINQIKRTTKENIIRSYKDGKSTVVLRSTILIPAREAKPIFSHILSKFPDQSAMNIREESEATVSMEIRRLSDALAQIAQ